MFFLLTFSCVFFSFFFLMIRRPPRSTLFPTRRSSDLGVSGPGDVWSRAGRGRTHRDRCPARQPMERDRKSTRLNSSHTVISYAVFCLKKKKKKKKKKQ